MSKSSTVPSSQTSQICSADQQFHCITFKIVEILILNANTANIKQLSSRPEKLPSYQALGRLGPLGVKVTGLELDKLFLMFLAYYASAIL